MIGTRETLIAATVAHLDARGLDGLTLRQVARDAGVSHGAPLRHFAGLSALLSAVAAASFDTMTETIRSRSAPLDDDPLPRLFRAGRGYVEYALANPGAYQLMFRPELLDRTDPDYLRASTAAYDELATLTASAQTTGWRSESPHELLTGVLWAGVHGIASLQIQGALPPAATSVDTSGLLDVFQIDLAGLPETTDRNTS
ncbi:TetR/AcrR family transcriptional regulator [Ilumatobacter sp.]|uniref:TetR/AcrR family transcriptional regulator n=1 Tax=Ilumatobacter sp. TaxID=1967498 RepID=UPI003C479A52